MPLTIKSLTAATTTPVRHDDVAADYLRFRQRGGDWPSGPYATPMVWRVARKTSHPRQCRQPTKVGMEDTPAAPVRRIFSLPANSGGWMKRHFHDERLQSGQNLNCRSAASRPQPETLLGRGQCQVRAGWSTPIHVYDAGLWSRTVMPLAACERRPR